MNIITEDGSVIVKRFGKYEEDLIFIHNDKSKSIDSFYVYDRKLNSLFSTLFEASYMRGDFFVSKKGNNCFRIDPNGKHTLIRTIIGRDFADYADGSIRGGNVSAHILYTKKKMSNGGGRGRKYYIFDCKREELENIIIKNTKLEDII